MTVMQDQEFAMTIEENIKIEASDGKSVRLSATGWQWRRSQGAYERGWGTTTELLIGHVDLQRLSLPYAYNYGRVISELELRCEESTYVAMNLAGRSGTTATSGPARNAAHETPPRKCPSKTESTAPATGAIRSSSALCAVMCLRGTRKPRLWKL